MLDLRVLGPLEAHGDTGPIPLGGQKQRALLSLLILNAGRVVATDRLLDELWGEDPPKTAATSLQNMVSNLRKALGVERLETRPPGYRLVVDEAETDLGRFERLVAQAREVSDEPRSRTLSAALALWRGAPLADFAYETFAQGEIRRLEERRLSIVEERIDAGLGCGREHELVGELEPLVAQQPFRERLRGQYMLALYRAGRQAEALQSYHDVRRGLVDELGIEPGRSLQDLFARILRHDQSLERRDEVAATGGAERRRDRGGPPGLRARLGREPHVRGRRQGARASGSREPGAAPRRRIRVSAGDRNRADEGGPVRGGHAGNRAALRRAPPPARPGLPAGRRASVPRRPARAAARSRRTAAAARHHELRPRPRARPGATAASFCTARPAGRPG